jgi:hypothetical protein
VPELQPLRLLKPWRLLPHAGKLHCPSANLSHRAAHEAQVPRYSRRRSRITTNGRFRVELLLIRRRSPAAPGLLPPPDLADRTTAPSRLSVPATGGIPANSHRWSFRCQSQQFRRRHGPAAAACALAASPVAQPSLSPARSPHAEATDAPPCAKYHASGRHPAMFLSALRPSSPPSPSAPRSTAGRARCRRSGT